MRSFQILSTQLSVCFLSYFPVSLPQLFHRCFPFGSLLWDQRLAFTHLSTASALASHYSASVLPFPSLPRFASQLAFQVLRICFSFFGFLLSVPPGFPCVPFRFWYLAFCLFPFALPCFAPTAVRQVLAFRFPSGILLGFRLSFVHFHFRFRLLSLCSSFSEFPCFALQPAFQVLLTLFSLRQLSPFVTPGFPCVSPGSSVLGFLFVSFRPSLLRSHSCSAGARLSVPLWRSPWLPHSFVRFCFRLQLLSVLLFLSLHPNLPSQLF